MIPASQAHGVPGADDAEIFAEIARGAGASADALRRQRGRVLRLGLRLSLRLQQLHRLRVGRLPVQDVYRLQAAGAT
jgi:hypothetical protein